MKTLFRVCLVSAIAFGLILAVFFFSPVWALYALIAYQFAFTAFAAFVLYRKVNEPEEAKQAEEPIEEATQAEEPIEEAAQAENPIKDAPEEA